MGRYFGKADVNRLKRGLSKVNPLQHARKTVAHKIATVVKRRRAITGDEPPPKALRVV